MLPYPGVVFIGLAATGFEICTVVILFAIAFAKSPIHLEVPLRLGRELDRKHQSRHRADLGRVKRAYQLLQPTRVEQHIVVRIGDNVAGCLERAGIARNIQGRVAATLRRD